MYRYGPAILRLVVGVTFAVHGAQQLFGVLGGGGLAAFADMLARAGLSPAWPIALAMMLPQAGHNTRGPPMPPASCPRATRRPKMSANRTWGVLALVAVLSMVFPAPS